MLTFSSSPDWLPSPHPSAYDFSSTILCSMLATYVSVYSANCPDGVNLRDVQLQRHPSSRAMRLVDDPTRFLLVSLPKQVDIRVLRATLLEWVHEGVEINSIRSANPV